ncbi:MAG TPA: ABC transporter permease [Rhizomicrobium sp.]
MKYIPLVWAAIMRKPTRAILTLLSVMIAFTLFGLTIGMNATFAAVQAAAKDNRIYTIPRFAGGMTTMPLAVAREIERIPGVAEAGYQNYIPGYITNPKNRIFVQMYGDNARKVFTEFPITPAQWDLLHNERDGVLVSQYQADKWHLKAGDRLTVVSPLVKKADGSTTWTFKVLAIVGDMAYNTNGYIWGNYDYFDKARPLAQRGQIMNLQIQTSDASRTADIAQQIDESFANSPNTTQSITEKAAMDVSNSGVDIATVDREIALAGMFMVLFLTANGIAQAVRERFAEFATLKTIGFSDTGVIALVFAEAALPCFLGAILGVGLSAWLSGLTPHLMPPSMGTPPLPRVTVMVAVWAGLSALAVALASSALPALRLKRMDIATALSGR